MRLISAAAAIFVLSVTIAFSDGYLGQGRRTNEGQQIFRFDTFGDEQLWTAVLRMHEAIAAVSPATALGVGLKVDVEALPPNVIDALKRFS